MLIAPMLMALGATDAQPGFVTRIFGLTPTPTQMLGLFVLLVLQRGIVVHTSNMASQRIEINLVDGLRSRAWEALLHCDWRTLSEMRQTKNASLLISDVDRAGTAVSQAMTIVAKAITLIGIGAAGLAISAPITLAVGLASVLVLLAYRSMRRKAARLGEHLSEANENIYMTTAEGLGALRVIKSFGMEDNTVTKFRSNFLKLRIVQRSYLRDSDFAQIALQSGASLLLAIVVWLAIYRWGTAPTTILPLIALFARALPMLADLQTSLQGWAFCRPAITAALTLIGQAEASREPDSEGAIPPNLSREMTVDNVTVRFAGRELPALKSVSLTIPARQITAVVGPSGAGKSTLADLVGGLTAPDEGRIFVDGIALYGGLRQAWRKKVAYVQQDPVLFTGTIRSNLTWADSSARDEELLQVLSDASAHFVKGLPDGLDTPVGEHGRQLSGGERQRIVLARALLRGPELLILDEATSALDSESERVIADAIIRLRGRLTILIISHRGLLQQVADRIVSLESGTARDMGAALSSL